LASVLQAPTLARGYAGHGALSRRKYLYRALGVLALILDFKPAQNNRPETAPGDQDCWIEKGKIKRGVDYYDEAAQ